MHREGIFQTHIPALGATATASSAGVAKMRWGPVPEGYCWYIERYSGYCPTAAATAAVFVVLGSTGTAAVDPSYQMDSTIMAAAQTSVVGDANQPIYVPAGYHFVFQFTGATSGDKCVGSIQHAVHQLDPRVGNMSSADVHQLQLAHQHNTAPLTDVATAGKRAV